MRFSVETRAWLCSNFSPEFGGDEEDDDTGTIVGVSFAIVIALTLGGLGVTGILHTAILSLLMISSL